MSPVDDELRSLFEAAAGEPPRRLTAASVRRRVVRRRLAVAGAAAGVAAIVAGAAVLTSVVAGGPGREPAAGGSTRSATPPAVRGYPAAYVSIAPHGAGIAVYSSADGSLVRRLTRGDRDGTPSLSADRRWVYFTRPGSDGCHYALWRVPVAGGAARRVTTIGSATDAVAVSPDGRRIAYGTLVSPCSSGKGPSAVDVVDLRTGQRHRIAGDAGYGPGLAWAPDGSTLAVATASPPYGADRIHLLRDPFRVAATTDAPALPCPTKAPCSQDSPSFAADGTLVYLAAVSPPGHPCEVYACSRQSYDVVRVTGSRPSVVVNGSGPRASVTVTQSAPAGLVRSGAVSADGAAVVYTLPDSRRHLHVWRWSGGQPVRLAGPGGGAFNPVW